VLIPSEISGQEHLREKGDLAPTVVEFAPWQWAAQEQMAEAFFREIALALGKKDDAKEAKKWAEKLSAYAAYLKVGSHLASGIRLLLTFVIALAGLFGLAGAFLPELLKPYLAIAGIVALILAGVVHW
jgi:hypothetical protein